MDAKRRSQDPTPAPRTTFVPPWKKVSVPRRVLRWLRFHAQWFFLLGLGGFALLLWTHVRSASEIPAYAMAKVYAVGSPQRGVVVEVAVIEGQRVTKGQVVARLDSTLLDADFAVANAKVKEIQSRLKSTEVFFELRRLTAGVRVESVADDAKRGLISSWTDLKRWRAELAVLNREIAWQDNVRQQRLGRTPRVGNLKARQQALKQLIQAAPLRLGLYQQKKKKAKRLIQKLQTGLSTAKSLKSVLEPIRLQLKTQRLAIKRLEIQKKRLVLRAPVTGLVKNVFKRKGEPVSASTTVLSIVEERPRHVIAYIRDTSARQIRLGTKVVAEAKSRSGGALFGLLSKKCRMRGKVVGLGPITILPGRFRDYIRRPIWARPITIELDGNPKLIPGERMHISFDDQ